MSKKNKKKRYYNEGDIDIYAMERHGGKKKKKFKKDKKKSEPEKIKLTLSKSEVKANRKTLLTPIEIPENIRRSRRECNHAGDLLTPAQFRAMSTAYSSYTPMLEEAVGRFGEENVKVCGACFSVLVDKDALSVDEVNAAAIVLHTTINTVMSMTHLDRDEVKSMNRDNEKLSEIISRLLAVMTNNGSTDEASDSDVKQLAEGYSDAMNQNIGVNMG